MNIRDYLALSVTFVCLVGACGEGNSQTLDAPAQLWSHSEWMAADSDHPFAEFEPDVVECPSDATLIEDLAGETSLSIDTGACNFWVRQQPITAAVEPGDFVNVRLWHFGLAASEAATGHAAIALDDDIVWQIAEPIVKIGLPTESRLIEESFEVPNSYSVGSILTIHIRNHGDNQWNWLSLERIARQ